MTTATQSPKVLKDIVHTAIDNGSFKTLAAALTAAGLVETLQGTGPFTVFAPTDAAFAKLAPGTVEALLKDLPKLTAILTYHVVPGRHLAADVASLKTATTVQGGTLKIAVNGGQVMINSAEVEAADVLAANGVIHVIDSVLLPS
ncbi:MAG: fasciclin domain-containing protein [Gemmatimonadales bacterium]